MMVAMSSGVGTAALPSQVNLSSSDLMTSRLSMSMISFNFALISSLTFETTLLETKSTWLSEWLMMFVTSFSELSGSIGMAMRPKAAALKNATDQFGMLWEKMATLSPTPTPYWVRSLEMPSHFSLKLP